MESHLWVKWVEWIWIRWINGITIIRNYNNMELEPKNKTNNKKENEIVSTLSWEWKKSKQKQGDSWKEADKTYEQKGNNFFLFSLIRNDNIFYSFSNLIEFSSNNLIIGSELFSLLILTKIIFLLGWSKHFSRININN